MAAAALFLAFFYCRFFALVDPSMSLSIHQAAPFRWWPGWTGVPTPNWGSVSAGLSSLRKESVGISSSALGLLPAMSDEFFRSPAGDRFAGPVSMVTSRIASLSFRHCS